jgi:V8-like Glu-specific endopeptidase
MRKHLTRGHLARGIVAASSAAVVTFGALTSASAAPTANLLSTVDQQAALDYWTPERMAGAESVDRIVEQAAGAVTDTAAETAPATDAAPSSTARSPLAAGDAPVIGRDTRSVSDIVTGDAVSQGTTWTGDTVSRVGRLYFKQGNGDYECTASSVDSPAGNVIVTAGHCITESGVTSTDLVFVPGLEGTSQPYGRFPVAVSAMTGKALTWTTNEWATGDQTAASALNFDVGFAKVSDVGGKSLEQTVGSFGIEFSPDLGRVTVFGYPGRSTNSDGYTLQYCTGLQFTDVAVGDATTDRATLCNMAGGSSGGPWLRDFDRSTGGGTVTSVVSFSYNTAPEVLYGPLFGDVVKAVYDQAVA